MESEGSGDLLTMKNVSYLRARDPSILAFNRPALAQIKTNLISELGQETVVNQAKQEDNIRVYLRIKKCHDLENLYAIKDNILVSSYPANSHGMRNIKEGDTLRKSYTFSKIFPPETTQTEIFNDIVKPKILDFINGQNSTLLTYGASGSGKTFTVIGTDNEPGVVPRSLEYLFRTLPQLAKNPKIKPLPTGHVSILEESDYRKNLSIKRNLLNSSSAIDRSQHIRTYTAMQQRLSREPVAMLDLTRPDVTLAVWVSFAEIYNEHIYDLLQPDPPRGQQRTKLRLGCSNGHTYIKNLTNISVTSGLEAYQILQYGIHNINYASTCLNSHSSRSHTIFTIKLVQVSNSDSGTYVSSFNFCDLAGCERSKKTMNVGDRLKESNNINTSLLVLGRCISAIRESQQKNDNKLVPFRESKLTQLFQSALAGHEDIAMIVTISPRREMFDETQHVLNFSAVAREIAIESKPVPVKKGRFSLLAEQKMSQGFQSETDETVEELRSIIISLEEEMENLRYEYEMKEKINRDTMIAEYNKILEDLETSAKRREKEVAEYTKMQCDRKLNRLKAHYIELLEKNKKNNEMSWEEENSKNKSNDEDEAVIVVDDSSDDEKDDNVVKSFHEELKEISDQEKNDNDIVKSLQDEIKEMKGELAEAQMTITRLQMETEVKEQQLQKLTRENGELKSTLNEGFVEVNMLRRQIEELEMEKDELRQDCVKLEMELEEAIEELSQYRRDCESPEEDLDVPQTPLQSSNISSITGTQKKLY